jgi:hypothetical protein
MSARLSAMSAPSARRKSSSPPESRSCLPDTAVERGVRLEILIFQYAFRKCQDFKPDPFPVRPLELRGIARAAPTNSSLTSLEACLSSKISSSRLRRKLHRRRALRFPTPCAPLRSLGLPHAAKNSVNWTGNIQRYSVPYLSFLEPCRRN